MLKAQVGLGVLSLPSTFHTLGLIPGVIVLVVIAILWTCESDASAMLNVRES